MVKSAEVAQDFIRALSVAKVLWRSGDDNEVREAVSYDNVSISDHFMIFQLHNRFLFKCVEDGNLSAKHFLAKIIIVSSSQLYNAGLGQIEQCWNRLLPEDAAIAAANNFMARVLNEVGWHHWELVRDFVINCSPREIIEVGYELIDYVSYFTLSDTFHGISLSTRFNGMMAFGQDVVASIEVSFDAILEKFEGNNRVLSMLELRNYLRLYYGKTNYSHMKMESYVARDLVAENEWLRIKMLLVRELGLSWESRGSDDHNPAVYFEKCRQDIVLCFDEILSQAPLA